jgi:hypothetical protein
MRGIRRLSKNELDELNLIDRLARVETKLSILGTIATAALGVNCAMLGGVLALLVLGH